MVLYPTYGRKYGSPNQVYIDWLAGLDFKIGDGPYINRHDAEREGVKSVLISYSPTMNVVIDQTSKGWVWSG